MTKAEREAQLKADMEALLEPINSPDDLRDQKKAHTKLRNKLENRIRSTYRKMEVENRGMEISQNMTPEFDEVTRNMIKTPEYEAVWRIRFNNRLGSSDEISKYEQALSVLEGSYPEYHTIAKAYFDEVLPYAEYLIKASSFLLDEEARLKGSTAEQFLMNAMKDKEITEEKRKAMLSYLNVLGNKGWKETELNDKGEIVVNGKLYKEGDFVGVMIGSGIRIHPMKLTVIEKEGEKFIAFKNYTRWRRSMSYVVLDFLDAIPQELLSEIS